MTSSGGTRKRSNAIPIPLAPVIKLPPDLAIPSVSALADATDADDRRQRLLTLRPGIADRTVLNAYVLPSLKELGLFTGTLRDGSLTRFGRAVASAATMRVSAVDELMARQLLAIDRKRVGFVDWLVENERGFRHQTQRVILAAFLGGTGRGGGATPSAAAFDRLGKWVAYLVYFRVLRSEIAEGTTQSLLIDVRHVRALSKVAGPPPSASVLRDALLQAYAESTRKVGSRLYIPISLLRDELGAQLDVKGSQLTDAQLDDVLRRAPALLVGYIVTFSPFSGPERGGLEIADRRAYVGFVSIRRGTDHGVPIRKR